MNISSKPLSRVKIFIVILIIFITAFNFTDMGERVNDLYLSINSPVKAGFWSRGISLSEREFSNFDPENKRLKSEIVSLRRDTEEIDQLREALGLELSQDYQLAQARVIGKGVESDSLIISKGSEDGIREGMPVVGSTRSLVGEITSVLKNHSHIQLISHEESGFDGRVQGKDDSLGVVERSENGLELSMIDRAANLEVGDMVVTHPGGGIYPGGIFVGEIEEVVRDDAETFQSAIIDPGFNPYDFQILLVITDIR